MNMYNITSSTHFSRSAILWKQLLFVWTCERWLKLINLSLFWYGSVFYNPLKIQNMEMYTKFSSRYNELCNSSVAIIYSHEHWVLKKKLCLFCGALTTTTPHTFKAVENMIRFIIIIIKLLYWKIAWKRIVRAP